MPPRRTLRCPRCGSPCARKRDHHLNRFATLLFILFLMRINLSKFIGYNTFSWNGSFVLIFSWNLATAQTRILPGAAHGLSCLGPDLCNHADCVFWTKCYGLEAFENLLISTQLLRPLKVDRPYQSLDEHDSRSWGWHLQDVEVTLDGRMCTKRKRDNLDRYIW